MMIDVIMYGASGEVVGILFEEPMCILILLPVSSQARKNGSHAPEYTEGRPKSCGFSQKDTAIALFLAQRRTSSAASAGSHKGTRMSGIKRPWPAPAHQSSIIQSL